MRDASICGLGQLAPIAIESAFDRLGILAGPGRGSGAADPGHGGAEAEAGR